ncbi:ribonuclease P protein subunit p29 [Selaginella moellendorffii]|uniref:ribonuclease P protein subunit p29 n=1 Tax=Selaginella moellendorffii TaxID=88036 RepID=UPI000D1C3E10|nr:ribonuclease P protein subunit p29 [Selaginella moellendorffii]|eukprot:XP_024525491.1 ribonuclease P protein subunit p29 [Selaginella moellendorffii]
MANATPSELKKVRLEALDRRQSFGSSPFTPHFPSIAKNGIAASPKTPASQSQASGRRLSAPYSSLDDPMYIPLPESFFHGEVASNLKLANSDGKHVVAHLLENLWGKSSKASKEFENKQNQMVQLDNPTTRKMQSDKARARAQLRSKRSMQRWSLRKHRRMGSYVLSSKYLKHELYAPLHEMWKEYMEDLIKGCSQRMMQSRILTAELHGAPMEVLASKSCSFSGSKGLMIRETENTFSIITLDNKLKVVPKRGSIFVLRFDAMKITLFGNNLSARSGQSIECSAKKNITVEL